MLMTDSVRRELERLVNERGESYAALSQLLGRNAAYIQQFVKRGQPKQLAERDRRMLARYFDVDETLLGADPKEMSPNLPAIRVPRLAVQASAGPGTTVEGEFEVGSFWFDPKWLRQISSAKPNELSIVTVIGDSMAPTLNEGDEVLVARVMAGTKLRDGIHVMRRDDALVIKRMTIGPNGSTLTISSDNPAYPAFPDCPISSISIIGRVIWAGRKFG